ncbi:MAG: ABC transporter, partial [Cyanobacteria bacterium P01_C01_bin.147]
MTSSQSFQRLMRYGRRYRRQIWLASLCSICNRFFDLAPPVLIGLAVDVVVQQQDSWIAGLGIPSIRGQFFILTAFTMVTWGLESAFQYAYSVLWRNLAQTMQRDLRVEAYSHLQD